MPITTEAVESPVGVETQELTPEQADLAQSRNEVILLARAFAGGKGNEIERGALNVLRVLVPESLKANYKPKEITEDVIQRGVYSLSDEDIDDMADKIKRMRDAVDHLSETKYQSPLPGGARPDACAAAFCRLVQQQGKTATYAVNGGLLIANATSKK